MPLLNRKPLEVKTGHNHLKDDDTVFYCELTNELFEDYEEYCQRIITCNSLIWSCAITGKSHLTYQEALTSEENALKSVKDFPAALRLALLYLANSTKRSSFVELADDVFNFAKDHFFLGESVETTDDDIWRFAHILKVIPPTEEEIQQHYNENKTPRPPQSAPLAGQLYKYQIERLDDEDENPDVRIISGENLKRRKGLYNRDKNRIYLKQFAEQKKDSWGIQKNILDKYGVVSAKFDQIFIGETPKLGQPKSPTASNKVKQQKLDKYFTPSKNSPEQVNEYFMKIHQRKAEDKVKKADTSGKVLKRYQDSVNKAALIARKEALKKEALAQKAKKLEELKQRKEKEREDRLKLAKFVKEWQRQREDLECEDLKDLPVPIPVDCRIPNEYFGDLVMILEFFSNFREVVRLKDFFPFGLKFDLIERALVDVEIAGPFGDILQLLLCALFYFQEQEDDEVQNTKEDKSAEMQIGETGDVSTTEAIKLATAAANWSRLHHGVPLKDLALDAYTVSEILRLHLLASGGRAGDTSSKWRYQERGGYTSTDDPGLEFRLKEPHILKFLASKSVGDLPVGDKIKVLTCLMNQILTYAELRDVLDDRYEKVRTGRNELRNDQITESKREREIIAQKMKDRKEAKEKGETIPEETEEQKMKSLKDSNKRKAEFQKRTKELQEAAMGIQVLPLGQDRALRRFWIFPSLPGLFVEDDEHWPGQCLEEPTPLNKILQEEDTMSYVRKLFAEEKNGGSDKENEGDSSLPLGSSKKKLLGETTNERSNANISSLIKSPVKEEGETKVSPTLICTANEHCKIHCVNTNKTNWWFYHTEDDINNLITQLNKRGHREHNLRKALIEEKDRIISTLNKCPVYKLNKHLPILPESQFSTRGSKGPRGYENANFKFPSGTPIDEIFELQLRDVILDLEEKIALGGLGSLKVKNRNAWRSALEERTYDKQCDNLTWGKNTQQHKTLERVKEESGSRPETPCSIDSEEIIGVKQEQNPTTKNLASAILQIARCVEPRYLQKPLPFEEKKKEANKMTAMDRWESSLMSSNSFSQLYLHVATLENSIQWKKSALKARCKICRRGGDPENMLLCDGCDRGFHLYCLKPKLTSIPTGDWFCKACRPEEKVAKPRRSRKLFSEESDEEDEDAVFSRSGRRVKKVIEDDKSKKTDKNDSDYKPYTQTKRKKQKVIEKKAVRVVTKRTSVNSDDEPLSVRMKRESDTVSERHSRKRCSVNSDDEPLSMKRCRDEEETSGNRSNKKRRDLY